jgi:hypothetical protein
LILSVVDKGMNMHTPQWQQKQKKHITLPWSMFSPVLISTMILFIY